jgi:polar amino acid transport system substrate-binding protein
MQRRFWFILAWLVSVIVLLPFSSAQDTEPVGTLTPPTLVPQPNSNNTAATQTESAVARIQRDGVVRVGVLYNAPPFGELNIRGAVVGFDPDLANAIATTWGVRVELIQVTRQTAFEALNNGVVDMLITALIHRRELDPIVDFSFSYYIGSQAMLVRQDDPAQNPNDLNGRRVGVVLGSPSTSDVLSWQQRTSLSVTVQDYYTLDKAIGGLGANEIDAVMGSRLYLARLSQAGVTRVLDANVSPEPYAIAVRHQDVNMRNLVNRTLQFLARNGRIGEIFRANFPESQYDNNTVPRWLNLPTEAPTPAQYGTDLPRPAQSSRALLLSNGVVRVAGFSTLAADAPEFVRRYDAFKRSVVETLALRWNVTVQYLPESATTSLDLLASGQADLAMGITPDWLWADRVDFSQPFMLRGYRLMVPTNSDISGFGDLRGRIVAVPSDDPTAAAIAVELGEENNVVLRTIITPNAYDTIIASNNANAAFGDSLWLLPQLEASFGQLKLLDRWYRLTPMSMAVQRNDDDFRTLLDYTLQDMYLDGTLAALLQPILPPNEAPPPMQVTPGLSG